MTIIIFYKLPEVPIKSKINYRDLIVSVFTSLKRFPKIRGILQDKERIFMEFRRLKNLTKAEVYLSLSFPLTFGQTTFIINILFLVAQIILLKKNFKKIQLLQIPVIFIFLKFLFTSSNTNVIKFFVR